MEINRIVLATHNVKKITEFNELFKNTEILTLKDFNITSAPEENGETFAENARIKALSACRATGEICLADDSGLCVDVLDGQPGVYSVRYGNLSSDILRNEYLLKKLEGVKNRAAHFVCAICCVFPDGREIVVEGRSDGVILEAPVGDNGFGYDPIFFSNDLGQTFAEAEIQQKSAVSHRGRAMEKLKEELKKIT